MTIYQIKNNNRSFQKRILNTQSLRFLTFRKRRNLEHARNKHCSRLNETQTYCVYEARGKYHLQCELWKCVHVRRNCLLANMGFLNSFTAENSRFQHNYENVKAMLLQGCSVFGMRRNKFDRILNANMPLFHKLHCCSFKAVKYIYLPSRMCNLLYISDFNHNIARNKSNRCTKLL